VGLVPKLVWRVKLVAELRPGVMTERRPFGGYLMCHGAGGVSGHFRFGARTGTAPLLIGLVFLSLGLLFGEGGHVLLRTIPNAVLGGLLLFSGIDLALSSKSGSYQGADLFLVILMAAVGLAVNPAVAFAIGVPLAYGIRHGWLLARQSGSESPTIRIGKLCGARADGRAEPERRHEPRIMATLMAP
jgi:Molybdate transporter of MFS superfamily